MAYRGIKVANVPLVPEVKVNEKLFEIPKHKIIGLTIQPDILGEIRTERVRGLGVASPTDYTDLGRILDELRLRGKDHEAGWLSDHRRDT